MYAQLKQVNYRPAPFEYYTADMLWADPHIARQMLALHLDENLDVASRNGRFVERSVDWIVSRFFSGTQTDICDFGCGPGLYTSRLARRGANVTGIDFSGSSIEYARNYAKKEGLHINYILRNYLEFDIEDRFDLITMIMCDFCALSPAQRRTLLNTIHRLLKKGGYVLLDAYSLKGFEQRVEGASYEHRLMNGFWSENDYYGFVNTFRYEQEKVVLDKYTIIEEADTRVIYNWLQYFSEQMLVDECLNAGFKVLGFYDDVAGLDYSRNHTEFAVIIAKE